MLEQLLPREVACVEASQDDDSCWLHPDEAALIVGGSQKRQREFATARSCARRALGKLGLPKGPILRGPSREPLWPSGVVGSITHCHWYRAAAVATKVDVVTLGIDAEVHEKLPADIYQKVILPQEEAWLANTPEGVYWDRLIFSAKESVYKAWFPLTGEWLGFDDVEVMFRPEEGTFHARFLVEPLRVADESIISGFKGRFLVRDSLALTAVALTTGPQGSLRRIQC
jgi:4'-phosphopantetheinyl transferase EntD